MNLVLIKSSVDNCIRKQEFLFPTGWAVLSVFIKQKFLRIPREHLSFRHFIFWLYLDKYAKIVLAVAKKRNNQNIYK